MTKITSISRFNIDQKSYGTICYTNWGKMIKSLVFLFFI